MRLFGIAEVHAVGGRQRFGTDGAKVTIGFGDRLLAAFIGIGLAIARGAVGGDGEALVGAMDAHNRGIASGTLRRVGPDLAVILFPDPATRGKGGAGHHLHEIGTDIRAFRNIANRLDIDMRGIFFSRQMRAVIERRIVGKGPKRNVADGLALVGQHHPAGIGNFADHREIQLPFGEDRFGHLFPARLQHHQHALLRFAEHHFIGGHAGFAARHLVHVENDADFAIGRHLDAGTGQARCTHILDRDNRVARHQFEAGLDQQFLGERIADLHGRTLLVAVIVKFGARHGRAVNPVAAGLGADIDDRIADSAGGGIENLVGIGDADGHRVDDDIAVIGRIEIGLAANGRHADAIAVAADAGNHALHEMLHLRMVGPPEAQCVQVRNGASAHRKDIPQDTADAGGSTLIGLDIGGMVMALHLEDRRLTVADIDDAGIFARAADHLGTGGRQLLQMQARGFIGTMFRPHHREDAEFGDIRLAAERVQYALIFLRVEAMLAHGFGGDFGLCDQRVCCHAPPLTTSANFDQRELMFPRGALWNGSSAPAKAGGHLQSLRLDDMVGDGLLPTQEHSYDQDHRADFRFCESERLSDLVAAQGSGRKTWRDNRGHAGLSRRHAQADRQCASLCPRCRGEG